MAAASISIMRLTAATSHWTTSSSSLSFQKADHPLDGLVSSEQPATVGAAAAHTSNPSVPAYGVPAGWLDAHIVFALVTYGLLTIAAVAGAAVFLQERALKSKQPNALTRRLPAVAESETLELGLLVAAEAVLALGLASGMAAEHFLHGGLLPMDHKTILSVAAFLVIGGLLVARRLNGIRGRRVARLALLAYLLLTLAYPGVKFVTDILMA